MVGTDQTTPSREDWSFVLQDSLIVWLCDVANSAIVVRVGDVSKLSVRGSPLLSSLSLLYAFLSSDCNKYYRSKLPK